MRILGISAFYHDSAAALIEDDRIVAAVQEERFTRRKNDANFPTNSIKYCLSESGTTLSNIDMIVYYEKPFLKFERLIENYLSFAPFGINQFIMAMPIWIKERLFLKSLISNELQFIDEKFDRKKLYFCEHHISHAASAYYPSPFDHAAVLTLDGVGEWTTSSCGLGTGKDLLILKDIQFPHSLGLLYSAFTYYLGFRVNSGEYKVMGLAPYGEPKYKNIIMNNLIDVKEDGSFWLDQSYFNYCTGLRMTSPKFDVLFGGRPRDPETELTQRHMDIASSIQEVVNEVVIRITRSLARETQAKNLCLAGGVALNCVANGKVLRDKNFERIWVQPAAGDSGGAIGAAFAAYYYAKGAYNAKKNKNDLMLGAYLGPGFTDNEIIKKLSALGAKFSILDEEQIRLKTVKSLISGKAIGWFQGRLEFGPRALGNRSIIADPRCPMMQKKLNKKIKFRESFRPFAPVILEEFSSDWFDLQTAAPYMSFVSDVLPIHRESLPDNYKNLSSMEKMNIAHSKIPAVTHVDFTARVQTVSRDTNDSLYKLLKEFYRQTGCPILVNTSFNVRGEPIVCTPENAFRCFMNTEIDVLVIGCCYLDKLDQDEIELSDLNVEFDLD